MAYDQSKLIQRAIANWPSFDKIDQADDGDLTVGPGVDDMSGGSPGVEWIPPDGLDQRQKQKNLCADHRSRDYSVLELPQISAFLL